MTHSSTGCLARLGAARGSAAGCAAAAVPMPLLALACLLGAAASPAAAGAAQDAAGGVVRGRVTDADGRPASGAQVTVRRLGGGDSAGRETAADGTYALRDVAPGLYAVTAGKGELRSGLFRIRVRAGRRVDVNLQLAAGRRDGAWIAELGDREAASRAFAAGLAASRAADHAAAVEQFTRAVERRPDCTECHYNLAIAHSDLEQLAGAEAAFRRVIALTPEHPAAYYGLASVYTRQGREADAAGARLEATRVARASLAERRRRLQDALGRAVARLDAGDAAGARSDLEAILQQDSGFAPVHYWLAVSLVQAGDPDRGGAAAALRRYLRLAGDGEHAGPARQLLGTLERRRRP